MTYLYGTQRGLGGLPAAHSMPCTAGTSSTHEGYKTTKFQLRTPSLSAPTGESLKCLYRLVKYLILVMCTLTSLSWTLWYQRARKSPSAPQLPCGHCSSNDYQGVCIKPPSLKPPLGFFGNSVDNKNSARSAGEIFEDNKRAREARGKFCK